MAALPPPLRKAAARRRPPRGWTPGSRQGQARPPRRGRRAAQGQQHPVGPPVGSNDVAGTGSGYGGGGWRGGTQSAWRGERGPGGGGIVAELGGGGVVVVVGGGRGLPAAARLGLLPLALVVVVVAETRKFRSRGGHALDSSLTFLVFFSPEPPPIRPFSRSKPGQTQPLLTSTILLSTTHPSHGRPDLSILEPARPPTHPHPPPTGAAPAAAPPRRRAAPAPAAPGRPRPGAPPAPAPPWPLPFCAAAPAPARQRRRRRRG